jgi:cob(I)alamin adenosyltransferase
MVRLDKIYTRGGDKGETSLSDGSRVAKHDPRVEAYGTVDEANAHIGLARLESSGEGDAQLIDEMLGRIQNDLFDLGADLARPIQPERSEQDLRIVQSQIDRLESEIDQMNADLKPLSSFILPGGKASAAHLHVARTIVRRAERLTTKLAADPQEKDKINSLVGIYLNRLSDHLFVLARHVNDNGTADVLWEPGKNR